MNCWIENCTEPVRWIVLTKGHHDMLICQQHAEMTVAAANIAEKPSAVYLYRIDCEGPYVRQLLALMTTNKEAEDEYPELLKKG